MKTPVQSAPVNRKSSKVGGTVAGAAQSGCCVSLPVIGCVVESPLC